MDLQTILDYEVFNNTGEKYLIALFILAELLIVFKVFKLLIVEKLKKLSKQSDNDVDDFLVSIADSIKFPFYFFVSFYAGARVLELSESIDKFLYAAFFVAVVYQVVIILQRVVDYGIKKIALKSGEDGKKDKESVIKLASAIIKIALWIIGILLILSNLGINVTSLVTGLGIGGIAIALAVQNILEDVFTSFSILIDKPFQVGDFIHLDQETRGKVKKIGIKTTRIQNPQGEEIVVSNKDLTSSRLHNFKKMKKRRVVFFLNLVYGTDIKKLKKVPAIIKKVIGKVRGAEFDRAHFREYMDFSLKFEVAYYVNSSKYSDYMNTQEKINLGIYEEFKKEKIEFAFPTQEVIMKKKK